MRIKILMKNFTLQVVTYTIKCAKTTFYKVDTRLFVVNRNVMKVA